MTDAPSWLPALIKLEDFNGDWNRYIDCAFSIFYRDFIEAQPKFKGCWVRCRRDQIYNGKEAGFWHCTSEGPNESNRIPDLRRCERIGWIRPIIQNSDDPCIKIWQAKKKSELRTYLWLNEEYLIVLGHRKDYFQLITAFCTDRLHTIDKLRAEYKRSKNN
jgi:hypothetical protein